LKNEKQRWLSYLVIIISFSNKNKIVFLIVIFL
jgi:hypothetical protein